MHDEASSGKDTFQSVISTTDVDVLPVDAVDLPADLQHLVRHRRRRGSPDRRAGRASFESGQRARPRRPAVGAADAVEQRRRSSTVTASPTSPRRRSTGVPGSARCWPTKRSPPTDAATAATSRSSSATAEAVDDAHHRVRRPAASTTSTCSTGPTRSRRCSATGSGAARARWSQFPVPARGAADRGVHHAARHAVRRDLHGARARAPARRRADAAEWPDGTPPTLDRRSVDALGRGRGVPQRSAAEDRHRAPGRATPEDRRVHRRVRDEPDERCSRSRCSSPTTC